MDKEAQSSCEGKMLFFDDYLYINSHQLDHSIFSRESLYKPSFVSVAGWGVDQNSTTLRGLFKFVLNIFSFDIFVKTLRQPLVGC